MTSTRAINAAAGVIHACMQQGKTIPQTQAYALDSAGLLNSPEIAAELEHLRKLPAERAADHRTWQHDLASLREARAEQERLRLLLNAQPAELTEPQTEALIDAGNQALADYYHERACSCDLWPQSCHTDPAYAKGYWDTDAFAIGLAAVIALWEVMRAAEDAGEVGRLRARVAELEQKTAQARADLADSHDDLAHALGRDTDRDAEWSDLISIAAGAVQAEGTVRALKARVAKLEAAAGNGSTRTVDEDPITYALTAEAEALHASSGAVIETTTEVSVDPNGCGLCGIPLPHGRQWTPSAGWHSWNRPTDEQIKERMLRRRSVNELRELLGRQREDAYRSPLHHDYAVPHDLPEVRP